MNNRVTIITEEQRRTAIEEAISALEFRCCVNVILAVEGGSRAWGFNSPKSDHDVRFVFVRRRDEYLRLDLDILPETIEASHVLPVPIELSGWDIRKALKLLRESNPGIVEWCSLPPALVYRDRCGFLARIKELALRDVSLEPMVYHYKSIARKHFKLYFEDRAQVIAKKYFYVLRPLLTIQWIQAHIHEYGKMPPISMETLISGAASHEAKGLAAKILENHRVQGSAKGDKLPLLDQWIKELFSEAENLVKTFASHKTQPPSIEDYNLLCIFTVNKLTAEWSQQSKRF